MSDYQSKTLPVNRGVTLNSLKDQLYSLNMRMLLAIESGKKGCSVDLFIQLSELFQVSLDYLVLSRYPGVLPERADTIWAPRRAPPTCHCFNLFCADGA